MIDDAVAAIDRSSTLVTNGLQITEEDSFFVVDASTADGISAKGTSIEIAARDYLLYTEGREERRVWRGRLPTALRVRHLGMHDRVGIFRELLSQVLDLSQVTAAVSMPRAARYQFGTVS